MTPDDIQHLLDTVATLHPEARKDLENVLFKLTAPPKFLWHENIMVEHKTT